MDELRIYYSHNPITYTLNKLIAQQNPDSPSQQITARGIEAGGAISVLDDGVWNIERTVTFLKTLLSINPIHQQLLHLFLPHTGYLLGKLVKISNKISSYSYVEEGQYSTNKTFGFQSQQEVNCAELMEALKKEDVFNPLGLRAQDVLNLNEINNFFYDCEHPKYRGAFSLSSNAFKAFPNVQRFNIDVPKERKIHFPKTTLVALPPLFQLLSSHPGNVKEIKANLTHLIQTSKCAQRTKKLVLKLHPQDLLWKETHEAFKSFIQTLSAIGTTFNEIDFPNEVDHNVELAFLGFQNYLVMGQSSAALYLEQFASPDEFEVIDITGPD
jgi:hypothetical protein